MTQTGKIQTALLCLITVLLLLQNWQTYRARSAPSVQPVEIYGGDQPIAAGNRVRRGSAVLPVRVVGPVELDEPVETEVRGGALEVYVVN